ncbi:unnamed protein product [Alopecurus aequalis]
MQVCEADLAGLQLEDVRIALMYCLGPMRMLEQIWKMPYEKKMMTVALLWTWWTERNKENHKDARHSVAEMQFLVKRLVMEWEQFFKPKPKPLPGAAPRWQPPSEEFIKINTDAAFSATEKAGGWGAIARDSRGQIQFAAARKLTHVSDALHAEALAVENAIRQADQAGIGRINIETDSQNLKYALTSASYDKAKLGHIFLDIKNHLIMEFHDYVIEYCPRARNKSAHVLAAMGMKGLETYQSLWLSDYPNDVSRLVADDLVVP